jgi:phosphatidylinositol-3-phosphatase
MSRGIAQGARICGPHMHSKFNAMLKSLLRALCFFVPVCWQLYASTCSNGTVKIDHVFLVLEENHNFADAFNSNAMPYLTSLAKNYAYAESYYSDTHPSIGNYFMLTTGQMLTNDDAYSSTVTVDNLVRHLNAAGLPWREYSESIPSLGYTGGDDSYGDYAEHHNPLSYLSDVRNASAATRQNELVSIGSSNTGIVGQLHADIVNHTLPAFGLIVPNKDDDAHDCPESGSCSAPYTPLHTADLWLYKYVDQLFQCPDFNGTTGSGVLIVVFDESENDNSYGGGRVLWVAAGPKVKRGYRSTNVYQHGSTLRFVMESLCLSNFPGAAASAASMQEFVSDSAATTRR